jgi:hypothetical protein
MDNFGVQLTILPVDKIPNPNGHFPPYRSARMPPIVMRIFLMKFFKGHQNNSPGI